MAGSTLSSASPLPTVSQVSAERDQDQQPDHTKHSSGPASERNPSRNVDAVTITTANPVLMTAQCVAGGHGHQGYVRGAEPGDDPGGHVVGGRDRGAERDAGDRHHQAEWRAEDQVLDAVAEAVRGFRRSELSEPFPHWSPTAIALLSHVTSVSPAS